MNREDFQDVMDSHGDDHDLDLVARFGRIEGASFAPNIAGLELGDDAEVTGVLMTETEMIQALEEIERLIHRVTSDGSYQVVDFRFTVKLRHVP